LTRKILPYILIKYIKGISLNINKPEGRIIMKEKERVTMMNGIIEMEKAEEAKRERELNGVEETVKKEDAQYNAKINAIENEILEEQDRVGSIGKSGS
jgi:hypothetical protein